MFHLTTIDKCIFKIKVSGKLTHQDYQKYLIPALEKIVDKQGKIKLLIEAQDFHGWEWQAAFDDLITGVQYSKKFTKVAIVGNQEWKRTLSKLFSFIVSDEVCYFTDDELPSARDWILL